MNTTYVYEFVNETVEIEISEEWAAVLREFDRQEYNNNQKETRRHKGLDLSNEYSRWLEDYSMDPLEIFIRNETEREIELIAEEILTDKQYEIFRLVIINGYSIAEAAILLGHSYQAARALLERSKACMLQYKDSFEELIKNF